jgi:Sec7-like guanine-nucleotide exchange factor
MELYDFTDQNLVNALRQICGRLVLTWVQGKR